MLKLSDLRKTTRRASGGNARTLHPHFLRDQSLSPRIEMAISYLESMLGRPRHELDQEVVVQLFGDHKLTHCIVACLASSYRHCCRSFAEVLPAEQVSALASRGITTPSELRLWLFHQVNAGLPGFVGAVERAPFLCQAGAMLGLEIEQIETLIALDTPEQAILIRIGPRPTPADVIARFNYHTVAAVLASAPEVHLSLAAAPHHASIIRELCILAGVRAELAGRELVLHGQQDVLRLRPVVGSTPARCIHQTHLSREFRAAKFDHHCNTERPGHCSLRLDCVLFPDTRFQTPSTFHLGPRAYQQMYCRYEAVPRFFPHLW